MTTRTTRTLTSQQPVARRWARLLSREGYRPRVEVNPEHASLSCIHFKSEGLKYQLHVEESDPTFFHLCTDFALASDEGEDFALLAHANDISARLKGVKITVDLQARVASFAIEGFADRPPGAEVFARWMGATRNASHEFFEQVRAEKPRAQA